MPAFAAAQKTKLCGGGVREKICQASPSKFISHKFFGVTPLPFAAPQTALASSQMAFVASQPARASSHTAFVVLQTALASLQTACVASQTARAWLQMAFCCRKWRLRRCKRRSRRHTRRNNGFFKGVMFSTYGTSSLCTFKLGPLHRNDPFN